MSPYYLELFESGILYIDPTDRQRRLGLLASRGEEPGIRHPLDQPLPPLPERDAA